MVGSIWVGDVGPRSLGCIPIGPVLSDDGGGLSAMTLNAQPSFSFTCF
jgi:hypothetical protein